MASSSAPRIRLWAAICGQFAIMFAAGLFLAIKGDAVMCSAKLVSLPEPAGWRAWQKLEGMGGYVVEHESVNCVGHGIQCGLVDTELREVDLCPRSGVSLDSFFNGSIYQGEFDLSLFASSGVTVVSHHNGMQFEGKDQGPTPDDETFLAAFRRQKTITHPAFQNVGPMWLSASFAIALIGLVFSGISARRELLRAAMLRDSPLYRSGTRDKSGAITFDDGTAPIASRGASEQHVVGPVVVRIAAISAGHYRESPSTVARDIVDGDRDSAAQGLALRANVFLKRGAILSGILCVVITVSTVLWAMSQFKLD